MAKRYKVRNARAQHIDIVREGHPPRRVTRYGSLVMSEEEVHAPHCSSLLKRGFLRVLSVKEDKPIVSSPPVVRGKASPKLLKPQAKSKSKSVKIEKPAKRTETQASPGHETDGK